MKSIFKAYYQLDKEEFQSLWKNSLFIFDTNVLLNLYRYQSSTRDALLKVMETLEGRVWIPYHVGLEFQRNRLQVIAEQHKRFSEVRKIVGKSISGMEAEFDGLQLKKRHSHINPDKLMSDMKDVQSRFFQDLLKLEEKSISINSDDEIRDRIDKLFQNSIGSPPETQDEIDQLFLEGEVRYKNSIPPGFKDSSKGESSPDEFRYAGITYKGKYGDLIIWKQIISHALQNKLKNIIFITDDNKADWWWKVDSNGTKTIGARPELRDEIHREAEVESFHLYNTEGFLSYANKQLNAKIDEETIEEVREIISDRRNKVMHGSGMGLSVERAVFEWLLHNYTDVTFRRHGVQLDFLGNRNNGMDLFGNRDSGIDFIGNRDDGIDIVGYKGEHRYGFDVKLIKGTRVSSHRLQQMFFKSNYLLNVKGFFEVAMVFVTLNEADIPEIEACIRSLWPRGQENLRIVIGKADYSEKEGEATGFTPYIDFYLDHEA